MFGARRLTVDGHLRDAVVIAERHREAAVVGAHDTDARPLAAGQVQRLSLALVARLGSRSVRANACNRIAKMRKLI